MGSSKNTLLCFRRLPVFHVFIIADFPPFVYEISTFSFVLSLSAGLFHKNYKTETNLLIFFVDNYRTMHYNVPDSKDAPTFLLCALMQRSRPCGKRANCKEGKSWLVSLYVWHYSLADTSSRADLCPRLSGLTIAKLPQSPWKTALTMWSCRHGEFS